MTCLWDRSLLQYAQSKNHSKPYYKYGKYADIFIGHTTTLNYGTMKPLHYCNVWNLDTGGGWSGKLTIMNVKTKKYWQSDVVKTLYPKENGRR